MPTGFNFTSYQAALVTQIPSLPADPNFQTVLPAAIDYAELTIQRDLDLFATHGLIDLGSIPAGDETITYSASIIVLEQLYYVLAGVRRLITPMSYSAIIAIYSGATAGPPKVWSPLPNTGISGTPITQQIEIGPLPDQNYDLQAIATTRLPTLSEANPTTYIASNYPDLFWAASMIWLAGYNRNFGAQADDPRQAMSWSAVYERLLKTAILEESRKRFQGQAWTAQSTSPTVQPPRK